MSDFAGLHIALTSLYAQRRGLEITGHNVANANTEGFSRRRVDLQNLAGPVTATLWSKFEGAGQGVEVAGITRYRDAFLEVRAALEHGAESHLSRVRTVLERLEGLFGEPGDLGIAAQLTTFWAGWDDVANNPSEPAARTQILERAATVAATFNHASAEITAQRDAAIDELEAMVADINAKAQTVASLNEAIKTARIAQLDAGDLEDRRDLLAQELAGLIGVQVRQGEWGEVHLVLNGTSLVSGHRFEPLELDASGPVVVRWQKDGYPATVTSGEVGGLLEAVNTVLPGYLADLDAIALRLRDDVNALHGGITGSLAVAAQDQSAAGALDVEIALNGGAFATVSVAGADWSGAGGDAALAAALQAAIDGALGAGAATVTVTGGNGTPLAVSVAPAVSGDTLTVRAVAGNPGLSVLLGTTALGLDGVGGRPFFAGTDAASLAVSAAVAGNPDAVAAATAGEGPLGNARALALADLGASPTGADSLYRSFVVALAVDGQTTRHRHEIQAKTAAQVDGARDAISGVNLDEEMTHMVQYQHAYDAAARYLTTIDEMLATLINRTGRVGL